MQWLPQTCSGEQARKCPQTGAPGWSAIRKLSENSVERSCLVNAESRMSIVRARICSSAKSLEWVTNPALFHAFSSLSFFVFEAS